MRYFLLASVATVAVIAATFAIAGPATQPANPHKPAAAAAAPADDDNVVVSKMRVLEYPGCTYLYFPTETTLAQMPPLIESTMSKLSAAIKEHHIDAETRAVFVYKGVGQDLTKPFHFEIGVPVPEGTEPVGDFKVRQLDPIRCASVIFSGPIMEIKQAYMAVFPELFQAGFQPTDEVREMHLYWEGPDSPNNVCVIQVGLR